MSASDNYPNGRRDSGKGLETEKKAVFPQTPNSDRNKKTLTNEDVQEESPRLSDCLERESSLSRVGPTSSTGPRTLGPVETNMGETR